MLQPPQQLILIHQGCHNIHECDSWHNDTHTTLLHCHIFIVMLSVNMLGVVVLNVVMLCVVAPHQGQHYYVCRLITLV
jgi:hypothetical protein